MKQIELCQRVNPTNLYQTFIKRAKKGYFEPLFLYGSIHCEISEEIAGICAKNTYLNSLKREQIDEQNIIVKAKQVNQEKDLKIFEQIEKINNADSLPKDRRTLAIKLAEQEINKIIENY